MVANVNVKLGISILILSSAFAGRAWSEELILNIGRRMDVFGGGYPSSSLVRFDSAISAPTLVSQTVIADMFWLPGLAVSSANVAYAPGSPGLIEAIDLVPGVDKPSLGPVRLDLPGFPTDIEFGRDGRLLVASNNVVESFGNGTRHSLKTDVRWGISAVDADATGHLVFWENKSRSVMRATPNGNIEVLVADMDDAVVDLKIADDGDVYLATLPYGRWYGETPIFEGRASRVFKLSGDGKSLDMLFSPMDFEQCGDCGYEDFNISDMHVGANESLFVSYNIQGLETRSRLIELDVRGNVVETWALEDSTIDSLSGIPEMTSQLLSIVSRSGDVLVADFTDDGVVNEMDIDLLTTAVRAGHGADARFDLSSDGKVNQADRNYFVRVVASTFYGDANLDGTFNSRDLVAAFRSGEYNDAVLGNSTWGDGDWNGDGEFDSADLVLALQSGGYGDGITEFGKNAVVPEPTASLLLFIGATLLLLSRRRHSLNLLW